MAPTTVKSLDDRIDQLERDFLVFRERTETIVTLLKWLGGFAATILVTLIIQLVTFVSANSRLETMVEVHSKQLEAQTKQLTEQTKQLESQNAQLKTQGAELTLIREQLQEIKAQLKRLP